MGSLWDQVDSIKAYYVPLAIESNSRTPNAMVRTFFSRQPKGFSNDVAVFTPNAKYLSHSLKEGYKKWRALPKAERLRLDDFGPYDYSTEVVPPEGGLLLKLYARSLERASNGHLYRYASKIPRTLMPGLDRLWLSKTEAEALLPASPRKGERWPLLDSVADRLCRRACIDLIRIAGCGMPRRSDQVLARDFTLEVEEVTGSSIRLRMHGTATLSADDANLVVKPNKVKIDEYRVRGHLRYDTKKKAFTQFDVIAYSETGHYDDVKGNLRPLGVSLELTEGKTPSDRYAPSKYDKEYFLTPR